MRARVALSLAAQAVAGEITSIRRGHLTWVGAIVQQRPQALVEGGLTWKLARQL